MSVTNVDRVFESVTDARREIDSIRLTKQLQEDLRQQGYAIDDVVVSQIITKHHGDARITNRLVEEFRSIAATKTFTVDKVISEIRQHNSFDRLCESKVDFILDDGSHVAINEDTYKLINNVFGQHNDAIDYMRQSKENFIDVVSHLRG